MESIPGSGSGARGKAFRQAPWNLKRRDNLRHKRGWRGALQRTWMDLGKSAESWLTAAASPNLPGRASLDKAAFSSTVHGAFSLARPTGPPRKPSEAVFVGRGERSGAVRALPFRRGECSAAFFDDNGGCNAHAASLRQQKRTGPFGPALQRFRKAQRTYLIRSPAASLALISFTASL